MPLDIRRLRDTFGNSTIEEKNQKRQRHYFAYNIAVNAQPVYLFSRNRVSRARVHFSNERQRQSRRKSNNDKSRCREIVTGSCTGRKKGEGGWVRSRERWRNRASAIVSRQILKVRLQAKRSGDSRPRLTSSGRSDRILTDSIRHECE